MPAAHAYQICTGLGAGNIGDEIMAQAFWRALPWSIRLQVEILPNYPLQHEPYPAQHQLIPIAMAGEDSVQTDDLPGLLVGDTPIAENEGLDFPLRFLAWRLDHFHNRSLPVDAIAGAGQGSADRR